MRVKLDENLPAEVLQGLPTGEDDVATVLSEGLVGRPDPEVLTAATAEARILVTLDVRLAGGAARGARAHAGVILVRVRQQGRRSVAEALARAWPALAAMDLRGRVAVVTEQHIRYRPR